VHDVHLLYTSRPMQGATCFISRRIREQILFSARLLLVLALAAVILPLQAKRDHFGTDPEYFEFDESLADKWQESKVVIPPYPKDQDLLPVTLQAADTLRIFIDRASVSRGADQVARFSLVVESPSGARSVFYDGMHCETRRYKTYAVGTPERVFSPLRQAQWRRITQPAINAFRYQLFRNYVCDAHTTARPPEELVRLLTQ